MMRDAAPPRRLLQGSPRGLSGHSFPQATAANATIDGSFERVVLLRGAFLRET
jgi:hypothetical protein